MVLSLIGAILSVCAAIYVFAFPSERLGRGVVTLFALFTILIACAYLYTTHCVRDGKCIALSYVYAGLTLGMGILSVIYAFNTGTVTPAFVYPNTQESFNTFTSFESPLAPSWEITPEEQPLSQPRKKKGNAMMNAKQMK